MKIKINPKQKVLLKSPTLYAKEENGQWGIYLPTKSGIHKVGSGSTENGAWQSALKFYNLT